MLRAPQPVARRGLGRRLNSSVHAKLGDPVEPVWLLGRL